MMALNRHLPRGVPPCHLKVKSSANVADLRVRVRVNHNIVFMMHMIVFMMHTIVTIHIHVIM